VRIELFFSIISMIIKNNNTLISISNPKTIFVDESGKLVVRTKDNKEYKVDSFVKI
jgi:hypothetical protein